MLHPAPSGAGAGPYDPAGLGDIPGLVEGRGPRLLGGRCSLPEAQGEQEGVGPGVFRRRGAKGISGIRPEGMAAVDRPQGGEVPEAFRSEEGAEESDHSISDAGGENEQGRRPPLAFGGEVQDCHLGLHGSGGGSTQNGQSDCVGDGYAVAEANRGVQGMVCLQLRRVDGLPARQVLGPGAVRPSTHGWASCNGQHARSGSFGFDAGAEVGLWVDRVTEVMVP